MFLLMVDYNMGLGQTVKAPDRLLPRFHPRPAPVMTHLPGLGWLSLVVL